LEIPLHGWLKVNAFERFSVGDQQLNWSFYEVKELRQLNPEIWRKIEFLSPLRLVRAFHWASNALNHPQKQRRMSVLRGALRHVSERFQNGDCR